MCTGWCSGRLTMYVASVCHIWPYKCVVSLASGVCMVEFLPLMFLISHRITHCKAFCTFLLLVSRDHVIGLPRYRSLS